MPGRRKQRVPDAVCNPGAAHAAGLWARLASATRHDYQTPPAETVAEAEFVTYSDGAEHRDVIPLGVA
jgi:hypothetical protein